MDTRLVIFHEWCMLQENLTSMIDSHSDFCKCLSHKKLFRWNHSYLNYALALITYHFLGCWMAKHHLLQLLLNRKNDINSPLHKTISKWHTFRKFDGLSNSLFNLDKYRSSQCQGFVHQYRTHGLLCLFSIRIGNHVVMLKYSQHDKQTSIFGIPGFEFGQLRLSSSCEQIIQ